MPMLRMHMFSKGVHLLRADGGCPRHVVADDAAYRVGRPLFRADRVPARVHHFCYGYARARGAVLMLAVAIATPVQQLRCGGARFAAEDA